MSLDFKVVLAKGSLYLRGEVVLVAKEDNSAFGNQEGKLVTLVVVEISELHP